MCSMWSMVCLDVDLLLLLLHYDIDYMMHITNQPSLDGDFELSNTLFRPIVRPGQLFEDSMILCMGDNGILVPKYAPTTP
jgi:hypothetical protein